MQTVQTRERWSGGMYTRWQTADAYTARVQFGSHGNAAQAATGHSEQVRMVAELLVSDRSSFFPCAVDFGRVVPHPLSQLAPAGMAVSEQDFQQAMAAM